MKRILALVIFMVLVSANAFAAVSISITTCPPVSGPVPTGCTATGDYVSGPITIIATISGSGVTQVLFYATNNADSSITLIGTVPTTPAVDIYSYTWNVPANGSYTLTAVASVGGSGSAVPSPTSSGTTNGAIDLVGAGPSIFPGNTLNPVTLDSFGEPSFTTPEGVSTAPWVEGDNQFCSANWPYNGSSVAYADGSCEWTNTSTSTVPPSTTVSMTLDGLDDAMHTLSDFDNYANGFLNKDVGTLNKTFSSWYPQMATWIAPGCTSTCTQTTFESQQCQPTDTTCLQGDTSGALNGRLLSIYAPSGYPGISGISSFHGAVDRFNDWNFAISQWLNNTYANSIYVSSYGSKGAWCVPDEATLHAEAQEEETYINNNSGTAVWGDLPHVIACLNYNAGPTATSVSNFQQCLGDLTSGTCPTALPLDCPPKFDPTNGACNPNKTGSYANWLSNAGTFAPNSVNQQCLSALLSEEKPNGSCVSSLLPPQCAPLGSPPTAWSSADSYRCDVYEARSYANWASNGFNYGPMFNYQNCLSMLKNTCPKPPNGSTAANPLPGTVCDTSSTGPLGRSLTPAFAVPPGTAYTGVVKDCDPSVSNSFSQWVNTNLTLFTDEQPKFLLRSEFLTDVYTRAQNMQSILTQSDAAMHSFLKTCSQCAYTTACPADGLCPDTNSPHTPCGPPSCADGSTCTYGECADGTPCMPAGQCAIVSGCTGGLCPDGSSCGSPKGQCEDGGPAAQLIYARTQPSPTDSLPNAVIYGWQDNVPTGRIGACRDSNNNPVGCAHIVKVTAYFPQRQGNAGSAIGNLQAYLPNIQTWTTFFLRIYALQQRDGSVYVSIKRWDQDHSDTITFPNSRKLWQFVFHNPTKGTQGTGLPNSCLSGLSLTGGACSGGSNCIGYGLEPQTVAGLEFNNQLLTADKDAFSQAFMLNDNGNGVVDPINAGDSACNGTGACTGTCVNGACTGGTGTCGGAINTNYCSCLQSVNQLLASGTESHACAQYVASTNATEASAVSGSGSGTQEADYTLLFVNCNAIISGSPPDDLTY